MSTYAEILEHVGVTVPDALFADLEVPVISHQPQRQGDILIIPTTEHHDGELIPRDGIAVVRGEATGNTHILQSFGPCTWAPARPDATTTVLLGHLHVPKGETCNLIHTDEHGVNTMGPGDYRIHGKRELAEEIRRVVD